MALEARRGLRPADARNDRVLDALRSFGARFEDAPSIWQRGRSLLVAERPRQRAAIEGERELLTRRGRPVEVLGEAAIPACFRGFTGALVDITQAGVHPVGLLGATAERVVRRGGRVFERSALTSLAREGDRFVARTDAGARVEACDVVLCSGFGAPVSDAMDALRRRVIPIVSHVAVTAPSPALARVPAETGVLALRDARRLYRHARYLPGGRLLLGGEYRSGHLIDAAIDPNGQDAGAVAVQRLHAWARAHHAFELPPIEHAWRGTVAVPIDGLPLLSIRRHGPGALVCAMTNGLRSGLLLGRVIARALEEGDDDLLPVFDADRATSPIMRLLGRLPVASKLRAAVCSVAIAAMRAADEVR